MRKFKYDEASDLFDCKLAAHYVDWCSPFESAVIKMQENGGRAVEQCGKKASEVLLTSTAPDVHAENLDFKDRIAPMEIFD